MYFSNSRVNGTSSFPSFPSSLWANTPILIFIFFWGGGGGGGGGGGNSVFAMLVSASPCCYRISCILF